MHNLAPINQPGVRIEHIRLGKERSSFETIHDSQDDLHAENKTENILKKLARKFKPTQKFVLLPDLGYYYFPF